MCYKLHGVSVANKEHSDGIYWSSDGHLIYIAGNYSSVQVRGGRYDEVARILGIDESLCGLGKYPTQTAVQ